VFRADSVDLGLAVGLEEGHVLGVSATTTPREPTFRDEPTRPTPRAPFGLVPLDDLRPARRNPRVHDVSLLVTLLRRFGLGATPVLDTRTGRLVAGHGRTLALRWMRDHGELPPEGVERANGALYPREVVRPIWLVPTRFVRTANDLEAEAMLLADNRAPENSGWQPDTLHAMLDDLARARGAEELGWSQAALARILAPVEPLLEPLDDARDLEPEERTKQLTIVFPREVHERILPRLAAAQTRHRAPTYGALLEALLALSERGTHDAPRP
jgi:hypothetical protein